ncbi:MAG: hypothetical protein L0Z62_29700 [Gemmataceae bacterium]|nr:hypothetical protein [Gemmataceae bacterium]
MDKKVEISEIEGNLETSPETAADDAEQRPSKTETGSHDARQPVPGPPAIPWNVLFPPGHPLHDAGRT